MRYVELPDSITVENPGMPPVPYTLFDLAHYALARAPAFNENLEAALVGASLKRSMEDCAKEWKERVPEGERDGEIPPAGTVWAVEDTPWQKLVAWLERPVWFNGQREISAYPIQPASMLVPLIERLKGASATKPAVKALSAEPDSDDDEQPELAPAKARRRANRSR